LNVGGRNWGKREGGERKNGQRHLSITRVDSQQTHAHTSAHTKHVRTSIRLKLSGRLQLQQSQSRIRGKEKEKVAQLVVHTKLVLHKFNKKTFRFPCVLNLNLVRSIPTRACRFQSLPISDESNFIFFHLYHIIIFIACEKSPVHMTQNILSMHAEHDATNPFLSNKWYVCGCNALTREFVHQTFI
jgi:hypothetical protein